MKIVTYEAVVEGGEVRLPGIVKLPEHAKVYVVVPGVEELPSFTIHTPHLLRPEQAADFEMDRGRRRYRRTLIASLFLLRRF